MFYMFSGQAYLQNPLWSDERHGHPQFTASFQAYAEGGCYEVYCLLTIFMLNVFSLPPDASSFKHHSCYPQLR